MSGLGLLHLVATPIGNLEDLSPRALRTLIEADLVVCEDTRRTGRLLAAAEVKARRLMPMHERNEATQVETVLNHLRKGESVALVSDAGLPGISDPGERLVRAAVKEGIEVRVVPGPSASVAALVLSGLSTERFVFEGFLPRHGSQRTARINEIVGESRTVVLYEAPHRLRRTLGELLAALGERRRIALCRELTKMHEEVWRGDLKGAVAHVDEIEPRGEYVVVIEGREGGNPVDDRQLAEEVRDLVTHGWSHRDASSQVASAHGVSRRHVYDLTLGAAKRTSK